MPGGATRNVGGDCFFGGKISDDGGKFAETSEACRRFKAIESQEFLKKVMSPYKMGPPIHYKSGVRKTPITGGYNLGYPWYKAIYREL